MEAKSARESKLGGENRVWVTLYKYTTHMTVNVTATHPFTVA